MSDDGLPPPPDGGPPSGFVPPPPPPGLTAPAGYVPFQNAPTPVGQLKRVGGLGKWAMAATALAGLAGAIAAIVLAPVVDKASQFLDGSISEDEFNDAYLSSQLLSTLQSVIGIVAGVLTIIWMFRMAQNVRVYSRRTTFHPVFAIVGWLLPPFLFVLPLLVLRELWKASDPSAPAGDNGWKQSSVPPLLYVWFVVYGIIPGVLSAVVAVSTVQSLFDGGFTTGDSATVTAEALESAGQFTVLSGVIGAVAAVVWVVLVKQFTARHVELTGET